MMSELVHFRLLQMPCCQHLFCNVNPRLPSYCPNCGKHIYPQVKHCAIISDDSATLEYDENKQP